MQLFQKLALRVFGLLQSRERKQEELSTAIDDANVEAVQTALLKGAVPSIRDLEWLLINNNIKNHLTDQTFIKICQLYQNWEVNLNETVGFSGILKISGSHPTLIGTAIQEGFGPSITQFLVSSGVKPTGSDLNSAYQKEADPRHLQILLEAGTDLNNPDKAELSEGGEI